MRLSTYPFVFLAAAASLALVACSSDPAETPLEIEPNMVESVPYDSFDPNPITRDGKTLIAPAPGTIPRGWTPWEYGEPCRHAPCAFNAVSTAAYRRAGDELVDPIPASPQVLARGKEVFNTFCYECHSHDGKGNGPVVSPPPPSGKPFPNPPSLLSDFVCNMEDGKIFYTMTVGQGMMPSYASQILPADRWSVIRYLRTLQPPGCGQDN